MGDVATAYQQSQLKIGNYVASLFLSAVIYGCDCAWVNFGIIYGLYFIFNLRKEDIISTNDSREESFIKLISTLA